ncbi:MAG: GAF domain-containing protein [Bacteroidetes bacterium]|jgi:GAF domain-containing protein|nr:GAF domain-containing protein [Bacteroidota bacterium]
MDIESIVDDAKQAIYGSNSKEDALRAVAELLSRRVPAFDWTGFYLASETEENMLELGPFVGEPTNHTKIPYGTGICGQVAESHDTFVVQDVSKTDNYLACSVDVQSEIVVPIMKNGEFVAQLDIDSHTKNAITKTHKTLCEKICRQLEAIF